MATAFCRFCKISFNQTSCPNCGSDAICDEEFSQEEGGAYPQHTRIWNPPKPRRPSFFSEKEKIAEALRPMIEKLKRKRNANK